MRIRDVAIPASAAVHRHQTAVGAVDRPVACGAREARLPAPVVKQVLAVTATTVVAVVVVAPRLLANSDDEIARESPATPPILTP